MRNRDERYESEAGMKRNLDARMRMRRNAKIEGILERERSRISSRYSEQSRISSRYIVLGNSIVAAQKIYLFQSAMGATFLNVPG